MTTRYHIKALDPLGVTLGKVLNYASLAYVLNCSPGGISVMELTVPATVPLSLFPKDGRLLPFCSVAGRPPAHDNGAVYLIRRRQLTQTTTTITAYHATSILMRRIIPYFAGSAEADHAAAAADNQIKKFARENLGSLINQTNMYGDTVGRDVSAYLSIAADLGNGASIVKAAAYRNLHDVAAELAEASAVSGTYCTFEIIAPTESTLELRTYTGQRGVDRRSSTGSSLLFSVERGNLENAELDEDWSEETTYPYVGGAGEGHARQVAYDYLGVTDVPFWRNERFYDQSSITDYLVCRDVATAMVWQDRARITLRGDLTETATATRGLHYDLGDLVTVSHRGVQYDMRLDTIHVQVGAPSEQAIEIARDTDLGLKKVAHPPPAADYGYSAATGEWSESGYSAATGEIKETAYLKADV